MAARRSPRVGCIPCPNVAIAVAAIVAAFIAACERDDVAGGPASTGAGGGPGGAGAGGSSISCNPTGTGCLCIADDVQPGTLATCSPTSVAQAETERGVCCVAQALCTCT